MSSSRLGIIGVAILLAACGGHALNNGQDDETGGVLEAGGEGQAGQGEAGSPAEAGGDAGAPQGSAGEPAVGGTWDDGGNPAIGGAGRPTGGSEPSGGTTTGGRPATGGGDEGGAPVFPEGGSAGSVVTGGTGGTAPPPTGGVAPMGGATPVGGLLPTGGVGPTGGSPPTGGSFAVPDGCTSTYQAGSAASGYCELDLVCDNSRGYTYCYSQGADSWSCDCQMDTRYQTLNISGTDAPCETVAEICVSPEPPPTTGPEVCQMEYYSSSTTSCDLQQRCDQTVDLGDGQTAVTTRYEYATCWQSSTETLDCSCSDGPTGRSFEIAGTSSGGECERTLELCSLPESTTFGEPVCQVLNNYAYTGYCELEEQCDASAPVSDGITEVRQTYSYAYCYDDTDGVSCSCYGDTSSMTFRMPGMSATSAVCITASDLCQEASDYTLSGTPDCSRAYQSASGDTCSAQLSCNQDATVGTTALELVGSIYVSCAPQGTAGQWTCTCSAGAQTESFIAEGDAVWDMCTAATPHCAELVDPDFSNGGGMIGVGGIGPVPVPDL